MAMQRKRRRRSGGNNNGNNNNPNRHFESNGPDVRIRGSAQQILDKYMQYARDAQTSGDRVKAEALFQHAEHYARIVAEFEKIKEKERAEREEREARKAEERAQREAERAAERAARGETEADTEEPSEARDEGDAESEGDAPRRSRRRKPREDASDALKVIDGEEAETTSEDAPETEEKPKRRRSYTRKKDPVAEEDGVMKTLARGAEPETVSETE
ncbi:DUF4167 domain-containing protein [Hyphomonas sp. FCG-A18]|uniref:DUF4167 domain-containing protein n=1 Tax=Hyphomonas sp. FCG-A18 TaxID=3080019 RepID=UPI002B3100DF|nr:DUF4167 domain-containing protein [Hyphomonas sp. FCG-A18]